MVTWERTARDEAANYWAFITCITVQRALLASFRGTLTANRRSKALFSPLHRDRTEAWRGWVSRPKSQSPRAVSPAPDRFPLATLSFFFFFPFLTFGFRVIIRGEVFPYVVVASVVHERQWAGGWRVGEIGSRAGLPQGLCWGWRAVQDFKILIGAV